MGVYVKNMEMPKKCGSCPFFEVVSCEEDSKDYRCARTGLYVFPKEKSIYCPLIEAPPNDEACSNWTDDPKEKDKPSDELREFIDHFWDETDDWDD